MGRIKDNSSLKVGGKEEREDKDILEVGNGELTNLRGLPLTFPEKSEARALVKTSKKRGW